MGAWGRSHESRQGLFVEAEEGRCHAHMVGTLALGAHMGRHAHGMGSLGAMHGAVGNAGQGGGWQEATHGVAGSHMEC